MIPGPKSRAPSSKASLTSTLQAQHSPAWMNPTDSFPPRPPSAVEHSAYQATSDYNPIRVRTPSAHFGDHIDRSQQSYHARQDFLGFAAAAGQASTGFPHPSGPANPAAPTQREDGAVPDGHGRLPGRDYPEAAAAAAAAASDGWEWEAAPGPGKEDPFREDWQHGPRAT